MALSAVVVAAVVASLTVNSHQKELIARQQMMQTQGAAVGAATTYTRGDWARALDPVMAVVNQSGAAAQIRDVQGNLVRSSPDYRTFPAKPEHRAPVVVHHRVVGSVAVRFGGPETLAVLARFDRQRWEARIVGGAIGLLLALVMSLVVAPRITAPLRRLVRVAREMASGQRDARVGEVEGFRDLRELGATFDQMADALSRQDQVRRNLVADMAHQLRTPISILQAGSEAMLDGVHNLTRSNVRSLRDETVRLGRMVDDLQQLSAAEAAAVQLTLRPVDLSKAATMAADSLADIFHRAGVLLVQRLSPVVVPCDDLRMNDIITNLLSNSAKFTPRGGCVVLETRASGSSAILRVVDTGIGIPMAELPHISERFFRGANSVEQSGSGIGLAIVEELVRGHHGSLDISSEQGKGTQVTLTFPRQ